MILCTLSKREKQMAEMLTLQAQGFPNCMFFQLSIAKRDEIQDNIG